MEKVFCVHMLASARNGTLYVGVTADLARRVAQHKTGEIPGFTADYDVKRLVWFERHESAEGAIAREKSLKRWRRTWKLELIEVENPTWRDLYEDLLA